MHTTLLSVRAVKAVSRSMLKSSMPLKLASSAMVPLQKQQQADRPVLLWLQASSRLCSRLQQTSEGVQRGASHLSVFLPCSTWRTGGRRLFRTETSSSA